MERKLNNENIAQFTEKPLENFQRMLDNFARKVLVKAPGSIEAYFANPKYSQSFGFTGLY